MRVYKSTDVDLYLADTMSRHKHISNFLSGDGSTPVKENACLLAKTVLTQFFEPNPHFYEYLELYRAAHKLPDKHAVIITPSHLSSDGVWSLQDGLSKPYRVHQMQHVIDRVAKGKEYASIILCTHNLNDITNPDDCLKAKIPIVLPMNPILSIKTGEYNEPCFSVDRIQIFTPETVFDREMSIQNCIDDLVIFEELDNLKNRIDRGDFSRFNGYGEYLN